LEPWSLGALEHWSLQAFLFFIYFMPPMKNRGACASQGQLKRRPSPPKSDFVAGKKKRPVFKTSFKKKDAGCLRGFGRRRAAVRRTAVSDCADLLLDQL
jgi:hypothetical protein